MSVPAGTSNISGDDDQAKYACRHEVARLAAANHFFGFASELTMEYTFERSVAFSAKTSGISSCFGCANDVTVTVAVLLLVII